MGPGPVSNKLFFFFPKSFLIVIAGCPAIVVRPTGAGPATTLVIKTLKPTHNHHLLIRGDSLYSLGYCLMYFWNLTFFLLSKRSSIKKENELIHFYRLSSIHASMVSTYKGILCLTLLGRRFREELGI